MNGLMNLIRESSLNRIFRFFARLYDVWLGWYRHSLLFRVVAAFKRSYARSAAGRVITRLLARRTDGALRSEHTLWARLLGLLHRLCERAGAAVGRSWEPSLIGRRCSSVKAAFLKSLIGSRLARLGMKRFLLLIFAFYLPVDFFFRELLGIDLLASLWDDAFLVFALLYVIWLRASRAAVNASGKGLSAKALPFTFATPLDTVLLLFFAAYLLLACFVSPDLSIAISGYRAVCQYALWFFVLLRLIESDADLRFLFASFSVMGVLLALYGCAQYIVGVPIPASWQTQTEVSVRTRVFGLTTSPNIMGTLMVMTAPLVASFAYRVKELWQRVFIWAGAAAVLLSCLLTFSRGAWAGAAVAVVVFALIMDRRLIVLLLAAIPAAFAIPSVANRILFLFSSDYTVASNLGGRAIRWQTGMSMFSENPIFGFGLGKFGGAVAMQNQVESTINGFNYFYMDNYYLKLLVEGGLIGLVVFLIVFAVLLGNGFRTAVAAKATPLGPQAAALLAAICGVMVHLYTENIFEVPYMNAYFWGFAAMLYYTGFIRPKRYCNGKGGAEYGAIRR